jgi:hypothetical protein
MAFVTRCGYECAVITREFLATGCEMAALLEQTDVDRLTGSRLVDPEGVIVDLLSALELLAVDEQRSTDNSDLRGLSGVATDDGWAVAEEAVEQIGVRGFNRGRDLDAAPAELSPV